MLFSVRKEVALPVSSDAGDDSPPGTTQVYFVAACDRSSRFSCTSGPFPTLSSLPYGVVQLS